MIRDYSNRTSQESIKVRKLDPLAHAPKTMGHTPALSSGKASSKERGQVDSVSNNILIKQMKASNEKLERIEHRIRSLEQ